MPPVLTMDIFCRATQPSAVKLPASDLVNVPAPPAAAKTILIGPVFGTI